MQRADFYLSLILIVISLILMVWVIPNQTARAEGYGMSPAAMPMICAGGILVFSLILMIKNLPKKWTTEGRTPVIGQQALLRTGLNISIALIGLFLINLFGYYIGGVFIICAGMFAAGRRKIIGICAFALITPAVVMLILRYALFIYLP